MVADAPGSLGQTGADVLGPLLCFPRSGHDVPIAYERWLCQGGGPLLAPQRRQVLEVDQFGDLVEMSSIESSAVSNPCREPSKGLTFRTSS
jgi:hypothetical protein